jgi:hypothetical protein
MALEEWKTRAVRSGDVHEIVLTPSARNGNCNGRVDDVAYVGFAEFDGGVIAVGDWVVTGDTTLGRVLGFDETHMPNHLNIVLESHLSLPGVQLGLHPGEPVAIRHAARDEAIMRDTYDAAAVM